MTARPQPVLKWAGGKRQLVPAILAALPAQIETYYEPFVGGGAVFFALAAERRFKRAVLADLNADLTCVYRAVRDAVEPLIECLSKMRHSEAEYYKVRSQAPRTEVRRAARVIYLNKTGYNGLYRVNRAGQFNVPFGRYAKPNICDAGALRAASEVLKGVEIVTQDFATVVSAAGAGDAVYFDPPYLPVSRTASFAAYHHEPFELDAHRRLATCFGQLTERGVATVLSNSDTRETRALFAPFGYSLVGARRSINSVAGRRGAISELLVCSPSSSASGVTARSSMVSRRAGDAR